VPDLFPATEQAAQDRTASKVAAPDVGTDALTAGKAGAHAIRAKPGLHPDAPADFETRTAE
jgi:hypothetical protein